MTNFNIEPATPRDSADLAVLADMAARGLCSYLWSFSAGPGQTRFEVGRSVVHSGHDSTFSYKYWQVARSANSTLGAVNSYMLTNSGLMGKSLGGDGK